MSHNRLGLSWGVTKTVKIHFITFKKWFRVRAIIRLEVKNTAGKRMMKME